jgi:release factor glutamine methyltransferase
LLEPIVGSFELICANLPYIPHGRLKGLQLSSSEPRIALDGGDRGLELIESALGDIPRVLAPEAVMLFEIDPSQGEDALQLAQSVLPYATSEVKKDLAGLTRLLVIETSA